MGYIVSGALLGVYGLWALPFIIIFAFFLEPTPPKLY